MLQESRQEAEKTTIEIEVVKVYYKDKSNFDCDCSLCGRIKCAHRNKLERLQKSKGGLALCPYLK